MHGLDSVADAWNQLKNKAIQDVALTDDALELASAVFYTGVKTAGTAKLDNVETWEKMQGQFINEANIDEAFVTEVLQGIFASGCAAFLLLMRTMEGEPDDVIEKIHTETYQFLLEYEKRNSTEH